MKNSTNKAQQNTVVKEEPCSEKKCATCFQNNGCMFEQYIGAAIHKMDELIQKANPSITSLMSKRA